MAKLTSLNAHYLRSMDDADLADLIVPRLETAGVPVDAAARARLVTAMPGLKPRATTLADLAERARFYVASRPVPLDDKAAKLLDAAACRRLADLAAALRNQRRWTEAELEVTVRAHAATAGARLGDVAQPLRAALTGSTASPGIFEVMTVLGRDEVLGRLADAAAGVNAAVQHDD
jgi:glutamyl-tRNA synthetase